MKTIHKYELEEGSNRIPSHKGMKPLHIGKSTGFVCLWAEVDTDAERVLVPFQIVGTGMNLPSDDYTYAGTAFCLPFVWHVYLNLTVASEESKEKTNDF